MQLRSIRSQIAQVKARLPPPPGRLVIISAVPGPRSADAPADSETWYFHGDTELAQLRERFKCEYESTRAPTDPPCLFLHFGDSAPLANEAVPS